MKTYYTNDNKKYEYEFDEKVEYENSDDDLILINNKTNKTLIFNCTAKHIYNKLVENDHISCEIVFNDIIKQYKSITDEEIVDLKSEIDKIFFMLNEQNIIFIV